MPLLLQVPVLLRLTAEILQGNAVMQLFTAVIALLVNVQVGIAEKVAVTLLVVPSAGSCTLLKICCVVELRVKNAAVAVASPLNTKLPDEGGLR